MFGEQQSLAFYSTLLAGDSFALLPMIKRSNNPYCLAVKLIEAHQVSTPPAYMHDHNVVEGIRNNQHNEPSTYYFAARHPGSALTGQRNWKGDPPGEKYQTALQ